MTIDLNPHHLDTVRAILAEHAPHCEVMAFGSRAAWTARERSDLDLAVACGERAEAPIARLREAFEDSDLPIRVDVLDWHAIADSFRETIAPGCVVIQQAGPPSGWRKTTLGECAVLVRDTVDPADFEGEPYVGLEHIGEGTLALIGLGDASEVTTAKSRFRQGDILFGKLRPYFRKLIRARFDGICSTDIWAVRPSDGVDAGYLFCVMASQEFVDAATQGSEGTRMPRARWEFVSRYPIALPPLDEQRRIARVLGALDERIEANRRATAALEEMARTLFRHWFVDFGPVRAKAAGLPSGLPPGLDALFPASLESSALGEAPAGWGWASVGDAVSVRGGTTPSTKEPAYWGGEHYFATPKDMSLLPWPILVSTARRLTDAGVARIRSGLLPPGTLLLSSRAPIGYLAITDAPVAVNQGIIAMVCEGAVGAPYTLHWVESNMAAVEARAGGTTFAEISKSAFRDLPFLVPPAPIHAAWDSIAAPLYERILAGARECATLAAMRDALLPPLVAGEVRVVEE